MSYGTWSHVLIIKLMYIIYIKCVILANSYSFEFFVNDVEKYAIISTAWIKKIKFGIRENYQI